MGKLKNMVRRLLIDAMNGLSMGIMATVVTGTILKTIGIVIGGNIGESFNSAGNIAIILMGAGVGMGVATKLEAPGIVVISAAVSGFIGSYATDIIEGNISDSYMLIKPGGDVLMAFVATYVVTELGSFIAKYTKGNGVLESLIVPSITIIPAVLLTIYVGAPISRVMISIGEIINWSTEKNVLIMGAVVAVFMGIATTFPMSSLALALSLNLSGAAAGAATVGCCVNMVGFATASFRDNKVEGFVLQSIGSSKVQIPNILKKPLIYVPVILASAILGPVAVGVGGLVSNATGAGVGSCGFLAQIMTYETLINSGANKMVAAFQIVLLQFVLPAIVTGAIAEVMRSRGLINDNDMKLSI